MSCGHISLMHVVARGMLHHPASLTEAGATTLMRALPCGRILWQLPATYSFQDGSHESVVPLAKLLL